MAMLEQNKADICDIRPKPFVNEGNVFWAYTKLVLNAAAAEMEQRLALHRHIQLKKRYILTRHNSVRLRYVALCAAMLAIGGNSVFMAASASITVAEAGAYAAPYKLANIQAAIEPAAGETTTQRQAGTLLHEVSAALPVPDIKPAENEPQQLTAAQPESFVDKIAGAMQDHISFPLIERKPKMPREHIVKVSKGDTIAGVLQSYGISSGEAYRIVEAMKKHYDPRRVKPGQEIALQFAPAVAKDDPRNIQRVAMKLDATREVVVRKSDENAFRGELSKKAVERVDYARRSTIQTSLYGSALRDGIPAPIVAELIRIYSWDVDFQRDIRSGDKLEVLYDTYETEDGEFAKYGNIRYASLTVAGKPLPVYRFETPDGRVDYYEPDGQSIKKALMRTPVDGARLSSGYGMRKHPVLGYNKMHKGLDFAAPIGTPIYAAGDGMIEKIGPWSSYGNYIRIRHNGSLKTAYAHLHKFKRGLGAGTRVKQGDVIGYVGSTGRSTGPHLHYEVQVNNKQVNPNRVDLPVGEKLKGTQLANFKVKMNKIKKRYAALTDGVKYAQADTSSVR